MTVFALARCLINKCEKSNIVYEEFLLPDAEHKYVRLLRINECPHCRKTCATITSPEPEETRYSEPTFWMVNQIPEGVKPCAG